MNTSHSLPSWRPRERFLGAPDSSFFFDSFFQECVWGGGGGGEGVGVRRAADSSCWFESHIVSLDKRLYSPLSLPPHVYKTGTRINSKDLFQLQSADLCPHPLMDNLDHHRETFGVWFCLPWVSLSLGAFQPLELGLLWSYRIISTLTSRARWVVLN